MSDKLLVESAMLKVQGLEMGTTIHHLVMAEFLETKHKTIRYYNLVNMLQNKLVKEGVFLVNEHGVGYRIAPHGEEINACEIKVRNGYRNAFRGVKNMTYINMDKIPETKKNVTISKANKYAVLTGMLKQGIKEIGSEDGKPPLLK